MYEVLGEQGDIPSDNTVSDPLLHFNSVNQLRSPRLVPNKSSYSSSFFYCFNSRVYVYIANHTLRTCCVLSVSTLATMTEQIFAGNRFFEGFPFA